MRRFALAGWLCASLVIFNVSPTSPLSVDSVHADDDQPSRAKRKRVKRCVKFDQTLAADQGSITLELDNKCRFDVLCTMRWRVVCDSDDEDSPNRNKRESFELSAGGSYSAVADSVPCGDDGWEVTDVTWTCDTGDEAE